MRMKRDRRRAFAATSSLQYRFLAMFLIYCFLILSLFAVAVFVPDLLEMEDQGLSLAARGSAANRLLTKHSWVWPAVFSLILLLGMHSFFAFQKIMGPLYRFRCAFEELGNGNLQVCIRIRKNDYLHAEELAMDRMITSLNEKIAGLKDAAEDARNSLEKLELAANAVAPSNEAQKDLLALHRHHLDRLSKAVQAFHLRQDGLAEPGSSPPFEAEHPGGCANPFIHGENKWETAG